METIQILDNENRPTLQEGIVFYEVNTPLYDGRTRLYKHTITKGKAYTACDQYGEIEMSAPFLETECEVVMGGGYPSTIRITKYQLERFDTLLTTGKWANSDNTDIYYLNPADAVADVQKRLNERINTLQRQKESLNKLCA